MPSALLTDLYELTMLQAYHDAGMHEEAVFEFFVRDLPPQRRFLMAAGLQPLVEYLTGLGFTDQDLAWLQSQRLFSASFLRSLEDLRFTGSLHALPEGTVFFGRQTPVVRVTAPIREAQLVESRLMNLLHYSITVASKAARCVLAAQGRRLVDFGLRRAHGAEAALLSARASHLAGFAGTATAAAGAAWGIPVFGTMAHAFVQAHDDEATAFEHFARSFPGGATLLIDTYDTEAAARTAARLAQRLRGEGIAVRGVRIDSGDLGAHARAVRAILDAAALPDVQIVASGNLDEHAIDALVRGGAPIDAFGVGTRMNVSADAPFLDCAYKLVEYAGRPRRKRSEGKATWPGRKQVFRQRATDGSIVRDVLGLEDEPVEGTPLLQPVLRDGRLLAPLPTLAESRAHAAAQLAALPAACRSLDPDGGTAAFDVTPSEALQRLVEAVDRHRASHAPPAHDPHATDSMRARPRRAG